jgi:hypothetical protein
VRDFTTATSFAANLEYFTEAHRQAFAHGTGDFIRNANMLGDSTGEKVKHQFFAPPAGSAAMPIRNVNLLEDSRGEEGKSPPFAKQGLSTSGIQ